MTMHIYAFGSVCRGEVLPGSDVDLLAVAKGRDDRFDPSKYSVYSPDRLRELWDQGNPFAWHLWTEARLLFAADGEDLLRAFGRPAPYSRAVEDCEKFHEIFRAAWSSLRDGPKCTVFDLSTVFLSIRNLATCFALGVEGRALFGRHSARSLGTRSIALPDSTYGVFERARLLCTRGYGPVLTQDEVGQACTMLETVDRWMCTLVQEARTNG